MVTPGTGIIGSASQGVLPTRQREDRQRRQQDLTRLQDHLEQARRDLLAFAATADRRRIRRLSG